jgi:hypothetical protein
VRFVQDFFAHLFNELLGPGDVFLHRLAAAFPVAGCERVEQFVMLVLITGDFAHWHTHVEGAQEGADQGPHILADAFEQRHPLQAQYGKMEIAVEQAGLGGIAAGGFDEAGMDAAQFLKLVGRDPPSGLIGGKALKLVADALNF